MKTCRDRRASSGTGSISQRSSKERPEQPEVVGPMERVPEQASRSGLFAPIGPTSHIACGSAPVSWRNRVIATRLALIFALLAATSVLAQSSQRVRKNEFYAGPVFTDGKNYSFQGGS